ncbi:hypothetical protein D3C77_489010 [compost metagenome]
MLREQFCKELRPEVMGIMKHDEILKLLKADGGCDAFKQRWAGYRNDALLHQ